MTAIGGDDTWREDSLFVPPEPITHQPIQEVNNTAQMIVNKSESRSK